VAAAAPSETNGALAAISSRGDLNVLSKARAAAVHLFVARRVSNGEDADDITQQALAVACAELDRFRGENPLSWLLAIARNLIVDHYRSQSRFVFVELNEALAQSETALQSAPPAPMGADDCHDQLAGVFRGIAGVCLVHQVAILLADVYGHRDRQSAATLRMSVPCFKLLLHGARAGFREMADGRRFRRRHYISPARRLGVTCYVSGDELVRIRDELLAGLTL
jgi:DNA-directed RNA polymerase specialized sigma24 family protein